MDNGSTKLNLPLEDCEYRDADHANHPTIQVALRFVVTQYSSTPGSYLATNIESKKSYGVQDWFDYSKEIAPPSDIELFGGRRAGRTASTEAKKVPVVKKAVVKKAKKVDASLPFAEVAGPQAIVKTPAILSTPAIIEKCPAAILGPIATALVPPKAEKPKKIQLPKFKLSFNPYTVHEDFKSESYLEKLETYYWKNVCYQAPR